MGKYGITAVRERTQKTTILGQLRLGNVVEVRTEVEGHCAVARGPVVYIHPQFRFFVVGGAWRESFLFPPKIREAGTRGR